MNHTKTTFRLPEDLYFKVKSAAVEEGKTTNEIVIAALKMYCEKNDLQNNSSFINDNILAAMDGAVKKICQQLGARSSAQTDTLMVELMVLQSIIADNLEVDAGMMPIYRQEAIAQLKKNTEERFTKF